MPDEMLQTGAARDSARDADSMERHRCGRFGCSNTFLRKRIGRPREFCSEKCRRLNWARSTRGGIGTAGNGAPVRQEALIADLTTAIGLLARVIEVIGVAAKPPGSSDDGDESDR
jgi:hypothetical protein